MKKLTHHFLISLLLHVLLLFSFLFSLSFQLPIIYKPKSDQDVPRSVQAYIYHPPAHPSQAQSAKQIQTKVVQKEVPTSPFGIEKKVKKQEKIEPIADFNPDYFSLPNQSTQNMSSHVQIQRFKSDKTIDNALLQILYEATAAELIYPQIAVALDRKGLVRIRFLIHPNGKITNIVLLTSCGFDPLDQAGLNAIHAISPVRNASLHVDKPKSIVAEIDFR